MDNYIHCMKCGTAYYEVQHYLGLINNIIVLLDYITMVFCTIYRIIIVFHYTALFITSSSSMTW